MVDFNCVLFSDECHGRIQQSLDFISGLFFDLTRQTFFDHDWNVRESYLLILEIYLQFSSDATQLLDSFVGLREA
jgi:hypothetical protein